MAKGWSRRRSQRREITPGHVIFAIVISALVAFLVYGCTEWYGDFFSK